MKILLPWPDPGLSPNARVHRMVKAKIAKEMRQLGYLAAHQATLGGLFGGAKALQVSLRFQPPDGRRRDLDNLYASMKPYLDGVFDFLGVDDALVRVAHLHLDQQQVEGGRVWLEVGRLS